jgi:hypothetical protein
VEDQQLQLPASFTRPPRPRKRKQFGEFGLGETLSTRVLALSAEARLGESGQGVRRAPSSAQAATSFAPLLFWDLRGVQDAFVRR